MQCCAPFCKTTAEVVSSTGITFHEFPSEVHLRAAWLRALGKQDSHLADSAVVCSQHFMNDDFYATESGSRQICDDAVPSTVQVCMICFDTQSKLYPTSKYKLDEAYQHLVGQPLCDQGNLKQTLCVLCAQRLINFNKFRDKSLRARTLMMELVKTHELITMQHKDIFKEMNTQLKHNIVQAVLKPDHCDLYVNEDKQTDVMSTVVKSEVSEVKSEVSGVKSGVSNESVTVDSDDTIMTSEDNDVDSFITPDAFEEQSDTLLTISSTCKDNVETLAPIKQEVTFTCTICMMEFADEDMYNHHTTMHMEANQDQDEYVIPDYSCASDSNEIGETIKLEIEVDTRNTERNSDICDTQAKSSKYSNKKPIYYNCSNSDEEVKFPCTLCDFKTNTGKKLASHIDAHLKKNDIKIILGCDHCNYITSTKNDLIKHLQVHAGETTFACNFCNYKTTKPSLFQNHVRKHTGEKAFSCAFCDFKCGRKSHLWKHRKSHAVEDVFACKFCDYKCSQSSFLLQHLRTHTGDRPFSCELCPHRSSRRNDLLKHVQKTHTGEKPSTCVKRIEDSFACKFCDYKCSQSSLLLRHMRRTHCCGLCDYTCILSRDLVRHIKTHTGD